MSNSVTYHYILGWAVAMPSFYFYFVLGLPLTAIGFTVSILSRYKSMPYRCRHISGFLIILLIPLILEIILFDFDETLHFSEFIFVCAAICIIGTPYIFYKPNLAE
jgi:hypothetical protein